MSKDRQYSSNLSFHQNYIPFKEHINTKRYQHATLYIGQKILHQVLLSLLTGGHEKLEDILKNLLEIDTFQKKFFTDAEIIKLQKGNLTSWDITLLYKMIQKVCGLAPIDSGMWIHKEVGDETLESLLYDMKELRNQVSHNSHMRILSSTELKIHLKQLKGLSMRILDALTDTAAVQSKVVEVDKVEDLRNYVEYIIADVKKPVVEY